MATAAELAGGKVPDGCNSISFLPTLIGQSNLQKSHEFLYWEFHEGGFKQAALYQGRWKGIRNGNANSPISLFDLRSDPAEKENIASINPAIAATIGEYLTNARSDSKNWIPKWESKK